MAEIAKTRITWDSDDTGAVSGRLLVASTLAALADMTEVATFGPDSRSAVVEGHADAPAFWKVVNVAADGAQHASDDYAVSLPIRERGMATVVQAASELAPKMTAYSPVGLDADGVCIGMDALTGNTVMFHGTGRTVYLASGSKFYRLQRNGDGLTLTELKDFGGSIYSAVSDADGLVYFAGVKASGMSTWGIYTWHPATGQITQVTSTEYQRVPGELTIIGRKLCATGAANGQAGFPIDVLDLDTHVLTAYGITGGSTGANGYYWSGEINGELVVWSNNRDIYRFNPVTGVGSRSATTIAYSSIDVGPRNGVPHDDNTVWLVGTGVLYKLSATAVTSEYITTTWPNSGAPGTYLFSIICALRTPEGGHLFMHKGGGGGFYINPAGTDGQFFSTGSSTDTQYCAIIDGEIYGFTPGSLPVRRLQWKVRAPVVMPDVYLLSPYTAQGRA